MFWHPCASDLWLFLSWTRKFSQCSGANYSTALITSEVSVISSQQTQEKKMTVFKIIHSVDYRLEKEIKPQMVNKSAKESIYQTRFWGNINQFCHQCDWINLCHLWTWSIRNMAFPMTCSLKKNECPHNREKNTNVVVSFFPPKTVTPLVNWHPLLIVLSAAWGHQNMASEGAGTSQNVTRKPSAPSN